MLNFKAKKSLGQNFLKSEKALDQIIDAADPVKTDLVLEIGPGKGVLTKDLHSMAGRLIAVEKDKRAVEFLEDKFSELIKKGTLDIVEKDILDFDPNILKFYKDLDYKIVANIPYYITGEILRKFLSADYQPKSMTLLVQKEVATRIVARDNKESILSMSVKIFGEPKLIATVKKEAFKPSPKVDSAILHISNISKERLNGTSEERFFEVVKTGFSHKRKQLGSNLKEVIKEESTFSKCDVNKTDRAEDLSLEQWICLARK